MFPEKTENDTKTGKGSEEVDTGFINEKIKSRPINRRKLARRMILTAALAVLFGVIACVVFLCLEPVISAWLNRSGQSSTQETTAFPVETTETNPEDLIRSEEQKTEEAVQSALSDMDTDELKKQIEADIKSDLESQWKEQQAGTQQPDAQKQTAQSVMTSMVTVTANTSGNDWVGDSYVSSTNTSGVLIGETDTEYRILATGISAESAQSLQVTFSGDVTADATLKERDTLTGISILSVQKTADLTKALADVTPVTFGSSAKSLIFGEPVIALGSPAGSVGSVDYGCVTNAGLSIDVADSCLYQVTTGISGSTKAAGILVNTDGEVIGIIDMDYNSEDAQGLVSAIGISELKTIIDHMCESEVLCTIGAHGTTVPNGIHEDEGVPLGAYVTRVDVKSPAMHAGLQSGDIIVKFAGESVESWESFTTALAGLDSLDPVDIEVMRQGADGYSTVDLTVTPEDRLEEAVQTDAPAQDDVSGEADTAQ